MTFGLGRKTTATSGTKQRATKQSFIIFSILASIDCGTVNGSDGHNFGPNKPNIFGLKIT